MTRYLKKRPKLCSGVIAIANAFRWLGFKITTEHLPEILDLSKERRNGKGHSHPIGIFNAIEAYEKCFIGKRVCLAKTRVRLKQVEHRLRMGCGVILYLRWREEGKLRASYTFVHGVSKSGKRFYVAGHPKPWLTRGRLKFLMRHRRSDPLLPTAWYVNPVWFAHPRRYIGQRDHFRCGPIAVLNAFKWLGCPLTRADLPKISKLCRTEKIGTYQHKVAQALHALCDRFGIPSRHIHFVNSLTLKTLEKQLRLGNSVIASVQWRKSKKCHLTFFDAIEDNDFAGVNYGRTFTHCVVPRRRLKMEARLRYGYVIDRQAAIYQCDT
jgi:hypothetical protein